MLFCMVCTFFTLSAYLDSNDVFFRSQVRFCFMPKNVWVVLTLNLSTPVSLFSEAVCISWYKDAGKRSASRRTAFPNRLNQRLNSNHFLLQVLLHLCHPPIYNFDPPCFAQSQAPDERVPQRQQFGNVSRAGDHPGADRAQSALLHQCTPSCSPVTAY